MQNANAGQKYCRMLPLEHSAILSTFNKQPFVIKTFVLSIFEWPFYTDFTVYFVLFSALGLQLCPITNGTLPTESSSIDSIPEHEDFAAYQRELSRALVAKGDTSTGSGEVLLNPLYTNGFFLLV